VCIEAFAVDPSTAVSSCIDSLEWFSEKQIDLMTSEIFELHSSLSQGERLMQFEHAKALFQVAAKYRRVDQLTERDWSEWLPRNLEFDCCRGMKLPNLRRLYQLAGFQALYYDFTVLFPERARLRLGLATGAALLALDNAEGSTCEHLVASEEGLASAFVV